MDKFIILNVLVCLFGFYSKGQELNTWEDEASTTWLNIVEYAPSTLSLPSMHLSLLEMMMPDIQKGKIKFYNSPLLINEVNPSDIFYNKKIEVADVFKIKTHFKISFDENKNAFVFDPIAWGLQSIQDTSKTKKTIWTKAYSSSTVPDIKNNAVDFAATCDMYLNINVNKEHHHVVMENFYKHSQENYDKLEILNLNNKNYKQPIYGHYMDSVLVVNTNLESYNIKALQRSYGHPSTVDKFKLNGLWFYDKAVKKLYFKELSLIPYSSRYDKNGNFLYTVQDFKYTINSLEAVGVIPQKNIIYKNRVEVNYLDKTVARSSYFGIGKLPSHVAWPDTGFFQFEKKILEAVEKNKIILYADDRFQKQLSGTKLKDFLVKYTGKESFTEIEQLFVVYEIAYDKVSSQYINEPVALRIDIGAKYDTPSLWMKIEIMQKLPDLDNEQNWAARMAGTMYTSSSNMEEDREKYDAINKGCLEANRDFYAKYFNSETQGPITDKEGNKIKKQVESFEIEGIVIFDPETFKEPEKTSKTNISINSCYQLLLVNWWYFDEKSATLFIKNQACAPTYNIYDGNYDQRNIDFYYWYVLPK